MRLLRLPLSGQPNGLRRSFSSTCIHVFSEVSSVSLAGLPSVFRIFRFILIAVIHAEIEDPIIKTMK